MPACERFPNDMQNTVLPTPNLTTLSVTPNGQVQTLWKQVTGSDKSFSSEKRQVSDVYELADRGKWCVCGSQSRRGVQGICEQCSDWQKESLYILQCGVSVSLCKVKQKWQNDRGTMIYCQPPYCPNKSLGLSNLGLQRLLAFFSQSDTSMITIIANF